MNKILVVFISVLAIGAVSFAGEVQTVGVKGMVCSFCAQGITKKFKDQPEVADIQVSLENKFMKLTYKDGQKMTPEKITSLMKEAGYEVSFDK